MGKILKLIKFMFVVICVFGAWDLALAEEQTTAPFFNLPDGMMTKIIAWIVALQALAFGIGKGLTELSKLTENKWDNALANGFTKVAWVLGEIISKFGFSMPKQVVLKQAEKIKAKQDGKN